MRDYVVGDLIVYRNFADINVFVRVTAKSKDINNGKPGFDGVIANGPSKGSAVWGYDHQILDWVG